MIDVHCHLNFKAFNNDLDEVIKRASEAGVEKIINVGTKIDSSNKAVELAEKYENLYAIVGIHPHHADKLTEGHPGVPPGRDDRISKKGDSIASLQNDNYDDWISQLESLAKHPKVVGIGECGMDYFSYKSNDIVDPSLQREVFIKQIELAHKLKLPLQIHNRHAGKDILDVLINHKSYLLNPPGMFHCMSGNIDFLQKVLSLGFYVGFDGNITYEGKAPGEETALSDLVAYSPLDRMVIETDSPYLTPVPYRGKRNEPAYAIMVSEHIASLKGCSPEKINEQTTRNVFSVFPRIV
ncbi:MAG: TatD family hydrolase [Candidatus Levybacteria bacterium]|nr:TatD family hydrolase [Candidatus Levybacteria bacterium]